jgi:Flp pilus assembly protein TadG
MRRSRWRGQDGFIREILWLAVVIVVLGIVVLDGFSLFTTYQSVRDDALRAARAAALEFAQTADLKSAQIAAQQALLRSNEKLAKFSSTSALDGSAVFTVTASGHADTYVFKYLRYIGLKKWVNEMSNPSATRSSD